MIRHPHQPAAARPLDCLSAPVLSIVMISLQKPPILLPLLRSWVLAANFRHPRCTLCSFEHRQNTTDGASLGESAPHLQIDRSPISRTLIAHPRPQGTACAAVARGLAILYFAEPAPISLAPPPAFSPPLIGYRCNFGYPLRDIDLRRLAICGMRAASWPTASPPISLLCTIRHRSRTRLCCYRKWVIGVMIRYGD